MLSGRKPPFRLLVRAVHLRGQPINVRHAVSEGFVVATRRTRTAGKVGLCVCVCVWWGRLGGGRRRRAYQVHL
jgi:hypothetical protein